ncbi:MAG: hypothetical protein KDC98_24260, partial [Planctomycetes bacterium]|nr:hypothetical protein [Planctomycetota bacterium]
VHVLLASDRAGEALPLCSAMSAQAELPGVQPNLAATAFSLAGRCKLALGEGQQAVSYLERARDLFVEHLDPRDPRIQRAEKLLLTAREQLR